MKKHSLYGFVTPRELVLWSLFNQDRVDEINRLGKLKDDEIKNIVRTIGVCAVDTLYLDDTPLIRRMGISLMLTVTLMVFPDYYVRYELAQFN